MVSKRLLARPLLDRSRAVSRTGMLWPNLCGLAATARFPRATVANEKTGCLLPVLKMLCALRRMLDASGPPTNFANNGTIEVYRDIAGIDVAADGGRVCLSVVRAKMSRAPVSNRGHGEPSARQPGDRAARDGLHADHRRPCWTARSRPYCRFSHLRPPGGQLPTRRLASPLIALNSDGDFLIVDRAGEGENLVLEKLVQPLEVFAPD